MLNLWNLGFILTALTFVATARPGGITALGVLGGMAGLLLAHAGMTWLRMHQGRPETLVVVWSLAALAIAWRFGMEAGWGTALTLGSLVLILPPRSGQPKRKNITRAASTNACQVDCLRFTWA